jgi:hypothetical protein
MAKPTPVMGYGAPSRLYVLAELVELRHPQQHGTKIVSSERLDAAGDDDATTDGLAAQLVIQLTDTGRFDRRSVAHWSSS